jgi:hypothetical protein
LESLVAGRAGSACALAADVCGSGAPHLRFEQAQHDMGEDRGYTDLYADDGARHGEERVLARRMDEIERKLRLAGPNSSRKSICWWLASERDDETWSRSARCEQLGGSIALRKNLMATMRFSLI